MSSSTIDLVPNVDRPAVAGHRWATRRAVGIPPAVTPPELPADRVDDDVLDYWGSGESLTDLASWG